MTGLNLTYQQEGINEELYTMLSHCTCGEGFLSMATCNLTSAFQHVIKAELEEWEKALKRLVDGGKGELGQERPPQSDP